jgi:hypothetical protein
VEFGFGILDLRWTYPAFVTLDQPSSVWKFVVALEI